VNLGLSVKKKIKLSPQIKLGTPQANKNNLHGL
jgi:hypothetical protein